MEVYIFKKEDKFIGMDDASGGYPYETDRFLSVKEWPSAGKAKSYQEHFKNEGWALYKVNGLDITAV